jgi:hypothetical protein
MNVVEEMKNILTTLLTVGIGAFLGFFLAYFKQKGKNLATQEDIGRITDEIEKVKVQYSEVIQNIIHQNSLFLEEVRGRHQLRMAALDRRLQAHQEAFTLWIKLLSNVYSDTIKDVVNECQDWWNKNCIYLDSDSRLAFKNAYHSASLYKELRRDRSREENAEEYRLIKDAGQAIVKGAELPPLGDKESEILTSSKDEKTDKSLSKS